jgi:superfamily II RNA helicase
MAFEWAKGTELRRLVTPARAAYVSRGPVRPGMSGGDFVRNVKQLVDLLRQISVTEGASKLGTQARRASEELVRGVVAASSGAGMDAPEELGDDPREAF